VFEKVYFSLGENCLTDDIINRYQLKSFTTPYSWGRSNVEYLLQIEKDGFADFLNEEYLRYEIVRGQKTLILKRYDSLSNCYDPSCMNGFEFTHHDVLADPEKREMFRRRCARMTSLRGKRVFMFYHHRICKETDRKMLLEHLSQLRRLYAARSLQARMIMFTQVLVEDESQRKVERFFINGIHVYVFYTMTMWSGNDKEILWARCDDDLLSVMIGDVKNGLTGSHRRSEAEFRSRYIEGGKTPDIF